VGVLRKYTSAAMRLLGVIRVLERESKSASPHEIHYLAIALGYSLGALLAVGPALLGAVASLVAAFDSFSDRGIVDARGDCVAHINFVSACTAARISRHLIRQSIC